jgi:hypothetical protein
MIHKRTLVRLEDGGMDKSDPPERAVLAANHQTGPLAMLVVCGFLEL